MELKQTGLKLSAPQVGDIVTIRIKPQSSQKESTLSMRGGLFVSTDRPPEHENPNHYKHTSIWRVVAVNGNHAVVERAHGGSKRREMMPIDLHHWYEASELLAAIQEADDAG